MTLIFGSRWISAFGPIDNGTWLRGLSDLTEEDVTKGLNRVVTEWAAHKRSSGDIFPPNLLEFRTLCLPRRYLAAYHRPLPALPAPKITREQLIKRRREMLEKVGLDPARAEQFGDNR